MRKTCWLGLALGTTLSVAGYTIENDKLAIRFAEADQAFGITGIVNKVAGNTSFLTVTTNGLNFWSMTFRGGETNQQICIHNRIPARRTVRPLPCGGAVFAFEDISLPGAKNALDVYATVSLTPTGESEWRLSVTNRAAGLWALATTEYPYLRGVLPNGGDALVPTKNLGARFIRDFNPRNLGPQEYPYPSWYPMVTAFQQGEAGLYLAAHDREARYKKLKYGSDGRVYFDTLVENAGVRNATTDGPRYPVVLAAYRGDWWQAAKLYRAHAMTCPWVAKGPIARRADYPKAMAETALWCRMAGSFENATNRAAEIRAKWPDLKIGGHWYGWNIQPFDTDYPEFRAQAGVPAYLHGLRDDRLMPMPYVNGRLWDTQLASYDYACREACRQMDGLVYQERYGHLFAVMCPACAGYQDVLYRLATNVVDTVGAPAIYYDQISCSRAVPCFNPAHGHPVGGGSWWMEGYRKSLSRVHDYLAPRNIPITSEGAGEMWLDLVDGHLICGRAATNKDVPFLPAVYSGYTVFWGSEMAFDDFEDPAAFYARMIQNTIWGVASGRWVHWRLFNPKPAKVQPAFDACADIIGLCGRIRMAAKDFLVYGHLEGDLKPEEALPTVSFKWYRTRIKNLPKGKRPPANDVILPAVIGNVWRTHDGARRAWFAANVSDKEQTVRFRLSPGGAAPMALSLPGQATARFSYADGAVRLTLAPREVQGLVQATEAP